MRERHPERFPDGEVAPRQGDVGEVGGALEAGVVGGKDLAAPDRPVRAVPGPVEGHADDRPDQSVLGHAGCDMGVVMLDGDER